MARIASPAAFALALVLALLLPGAVFAADPQLSATPIPGQEIDVAGAGFPAGAQVTIVVTRNGESADPQMVDADSSGAFSFVVPAGPGRGGNYTIVATSGALKATAEALAVETAGGSGGVRPTPPPTDTVAALGSPAPASGIVPALAGPGIFLIGLAIALAAMRRSGARSRVGQRSDQR